jgi:hypothetical protein
MFVIKEESANGLALNPLFSFDKFSFLYGGNSLITKKYFTKQPEDCHSMLSHLGGDIMYKDHRLSRLINLIRETVTSDRTVVYNSSVSVLNKPTVARPSDLVGNIDREQRRQLLERELEKLDLLETEQASKQVAKVG